MKAVDHAVKVGKAYEARVVIPHCGSCQKPCCGLETVVLDMTWPQVQHLYKIGGTKQAFMQALAEETAAPRLQNHIKESHGVFYAHGAACPAFVPGRGCSVYNTPHKPHACGEFPIYQDGDAMTVDLRCEAIVLEDLLEELAQHTGRAVKHHKNDQFPFLVTVTFGRPNDRKPPEPGATR